MTRYRNVRETLAREIVDGLYPVGERFPTDQELCERFSVSRHTVREALRDLQRDGVLARQRGAGTIVTARQIPPYVQAVAELTELDNYAAETAFDCITEGVVVVREQLSAELDCLSHSRWLRFAGLRYRTGDNRPLCWTEVFLTEDLIPERAAIRDGYGAFFDRARRVKGYMAEVVEQTIRAVAISKEHAGLLEYQEGAPALLVRRRYLTQDNVPFEITMSVHPADRYVSSTRLTRRRTSLAASLGAVGT
jgi:DNA-binding GntR family transcriptional regulator